MFVKELKLFDSVSWEDHDGDRQKIVVDFIRDIIGDEPKEPQTVLGIRYLYDEWDYEGCGRDDHYYLTFTDDVKMAKKTIKETEKLVTKLNNLGINAELVITE